LNCPLNFFSTHELKFLKSFGENILDNYKRNRNKENEIIVKKHEKNTNLEQEIIIVDGLNVYDGHHRIIAAINKGVGLRYIDLNDLSEV